MTKKGLAKRNFERCPAKALGWIVPPDFNHINVHYLVHILIAPSCIDKCDTDESLFSTISIHQHLFPVYSAQGYPLVNQHNYGKSPPFNGKINYFDWAMFKFAMMLPSGNLT